MEPNIDRGLVAGGVACIVCALALAAVGQLNVVNSLIASAAGTALIVVAAILGWQARRRAGGRIVLATAGVLFVLVIANACAVRLLLE